MNKIKSLLLAVAFVVTITFVGSGVGSNGSLAVNAQDTMLGRAGDKVTRVGKKVGKSTWRGTRRVGTTIGNKTWDGSKWVASKSWRGGKWVAVKTVRGTKWVYRKAKRPFVGPARRNM